MLVQLRAAKARLQQRLQPEADTDRHPWKGSKSLHPSRAHSSRQQPGLSSSGEPGRACTCQSCSQMDAATVTRARRNCNVMRTKIAACHSLLLTPVQPSRLMDRLWKLLHQPLSSSKARTDLPPVLQPHALLVTIIFQQKRVFYPTAAKLQAGGFIALACW